MTTAKAPGRWRPLLLGAAVAATFSLPLTTGTAHAGLLVASTPDCAQQPLSRPFMPWLDPALYELAPDGGFENGAEGWTLAGGAGAVAGNESHYVRDPADSTSLRIPAGGSATSPTICVGLEHPTLRFFAKKTSGLLAAMAVQVRFELASGEVASLPIGVVAGTGSWQPTLPMAVIANLLPLLPGEYTRVQFKFTPVMGGWRIDDVYVDPRRH